VGHPILITSYFSELLWVVIMSKDWTVMRYVPSIPGELGSGVQTLHRRTLVPRTPVSLFTAQAFRRRSITATGQVVG